ncbi:MAG: ribosomal-processing cysteine protease Prp [Firmicutes bacterium]|nr:ribosomal-processing cysteine protease Prp [Bacillota bacterium]
MIKVVIKTFDDKINNIRISGHAGYDVHGKDIVCAAVSSIAITTINGILKLDENAIDYDQNHDLVINVKKHNETIDILIQNMIDLLEELEKDYNKNIKINREVS